MTLAERQVVNEETSDHVPAVKVRSLVVATAVESIGRADENVGLRQARIIGGVGVGVVTLQDQAMSELLAQTYIACVVDGVSHRGADLCAEEL